MINITPQWMRRLRIIGIILGGLAVVQIILTITVRQYTNAHGGDDTGSKVLRAQAQVWSLNLPVKTYHYTKGRYPDLHEGLREALHPHESRFKKSEEEITKIITDPWGQLIIYRYPGILHSDGYDIICLGPDGKEGTEDDITN